MEPDLIQQGVSLLIYGNGYCFRIPYCSRIRHKDNVTSGA